jgi:Uma2 family endonuclease
MALVTHATTRPRKTADDLLALGDEVRAELIDGEIHVTPSSTPRHQDVLQRLLAALEGWVRPRGLGRAWVAPLDVFLPSGDGVQPDLLFVSAARLAIVPDWVRGAPDLVVEVVSRSHPERDRIVKRGVYARSGVPEHWIAEPDDRAVQVLRLAEGAYAPHGYVVVPADLTTPTFPGLRVPLEEVFEG